VGWTPRCSCTLNIDVHFKLNKSIALKRNCRFVIFYNKSNQYVLLIINLLCIYFLTFSILAGSSQIIAQYYQFLRLGFEVMFVLFLLKTCKD
jgi:hypothetical protein